MTEGIIIALITAFSTVLCNYIINKKQNATKIEEQAKSEQELKDRLLAIEEKLDIHNGYAEKFGRIEVDIAVIKNELKNINKGVKG